MKPVVPAPNQQSVWDYPRPPRIEVSARRIKVVFAGETIVDTTNSHRVLETSHPPVYYVPGEAVRAGVLVPADRKSFCEWKGVARYFHVQVQAETAYFAAWGYESPTTAFRAVRNHVAFYAHLMQACYVDGEPVHPQPGDFYGGWITKDIVGPFKGAPGTRGW